MCEEGSKDRGDFITAIEKQKQCHKRPRNWEGSAYFSHGIIVAMVILESRIITHLEMLGYKDWGYVLKDLGLFWGF